MTGRFARRMRRGVAGTAIAAAAMAALTASQAPGVVIPASRPDEPSPPPEPPVSGGTPYYTDLPPLVSPDKPGASSELPPAGALSDSGIPATVLAAYKKAAASLAESHPGCHLRWELLAAIGKVESGHARGGRVTTDGTTRAPILGPQLNGRGFAAVADTDHGAYDEDTAYDHAVGPMQFIPSTWSSWAADGNGDGKSDPGNVYDAALAAGRYLCAAGRDLSRRGDLERAILGYNPSRAYLRTVRSWYDFYLHGHRQVPDSTGTGPYPAPDSTPESRGGAASRSGKKPGASGTSRPGTPSAAPRPSPTHAEGTIRPRPTPGPSTTNPEPSPSGSGSASPSPSPSPGCPTPSPTPTPSPSDSQSPSPSPSPSEPGDPCATPSPSPSPSGSGSPSASPS